MEKQKFKFSTDGAKLNKQIIRKYLNAKKNLDKLNVGKS